MTQGNYGIHFFVYSVVGVVRGVASLSQPHPLVIFEWVGLVAGANTNSTQALYNPFVYNSLCSLGKSSRAGRTSSFLPSPLP